MYYNKNNKPLVMLQGKWLESLGYRIGDKIVVNIKKNGIEIKKVGE